MRSVVALAIAASLGCAGPGEQATCSGGKCDLADSGWKAQLDGLKDPIAAWLRAAPVDEKGELDTDYGRIVKEIAAQQGCGESSIRTYIVSDSLLTGVANFPRLISTVCSDDVTRASEFFIAASFPEEGTDDVDPRRVEMYAWDAESLKYHFYAAAPDEASKDKVKIDARPKECARCHLGPRDLPTAGMPMTPIMNELTRPWVHWNAEPDADSFEYTVPAATRTSPHFRAYGEARLTSAARLEKIIEAGHARVASARLRERRAMPASVDASLALLRPLFCEEQVNYATEDFDSGVIPATVVVPGGLREGFIAASASGWSWNWLTDGNLRLPRTSGAKLVMVPTRGNVNVEYEKGLLAAATLTPSQVLRVRALDWKTPVFSSFRCGLWKDAAKRLAADPPRLDPAWRNADAMKLLFEEIMKLDGAALRPPADGQVVALDVADAAKVAALKTALKGGALPACPAAGACVATLVQLGEQIDGYVKQVEAGGRAPLLAARDARLCRVIASFENKPGLPEVKCD